MYELDLELGAKMGRIAKPGGEADLGSCVVEELRLANTVPTKTATTTTVQSTEYFGSRVAERQCVNVSKCQCVKGSQTSDCDLSRSICPRYLSFFVSRRHSDLNFCIVLGPLKAFSHVLLGKPPMYHVKRAGTLCIARTGFGNTSTHHIPVFILFTRRLG